MGLAHTHHSLVDIDIRVVDSSELELVHQVIVHFLAVDACVQPGGVERGDAVGKTFLHEVVAQIQMIVATHRNSHVQRTFPVGICQHLKHHQLALVQHTFAFQGDTHVIGDFTMQGVGNHHARAFHCLLVQLDDDAVLLWVSVPSISEYFSIHTGCLRIPWRLLPGSACRSY